MDNDLNVTSTGVNSFMCRRNERLEYVSTHSSLMGDKSTTLQKIFSKSDRSGVHLNDDGKQLVMSTIMTAIQRLVAEAETPATESDKRKPSQTTPGSPTVHLKSKSHVTHSRTLTTPHLVRSTHQQTQ